MAANRARDAFFIERQIPSILPPHSRTTGFVYGEMDAGVKYARISVVGKGDIEAFDFALPVPGPHSLEQAYVPTRFIRIRSQT